MTGGNWDMYVRTDFRKSTAPQQATGADSYVNRDYSVSSKFPPDPSAAMIAQGLRPPTHYESSDHEMIFGDLE
jgi:hypothetical protein